jgi:hypothetical protein
MGSPFKILRRFKMLTSEKTTIIYEGKYKKVYWKIVEENKSIVKWTAGFRGTGTVSTIEEAELAITKCIDDSLKQQV